jgi:hypothetical protein
MYKSDFISEFILAIYWLKATLMHNRLQRKKPMVNLITTAGVPAAALLR